MFRAFCCVLGLAGIAGLLFSNNELRAQLEDYDGDRVTTSDRDTDGDGLSDKRDPCPESAVDMDGDDIQDGCDPDIDGDGIPNTLTLINMSVTQVKPAQFDNCAYVSNQDQKDTDRDGFGDACDDCPTIWNEQGYDGQFFARAPCPETKKTVR